MVVASLWLPSQFSVVAETELWISGLHQNCLSTTAHVSSWEMACAVGKSFLATLMRMAELSIESLVLNNTFSRPETRESIFNRLQQESLTSYLFFLHVGDLSRRKLCSSLKAWLGYVVLRCINHQSLAALYSSFLMKTAIPSDMCQVPNANFSYLSPVTFELEIMYATWTSC